MQISTQGWETQLYPAFRIPWSDLWDGFESEVSFVEDIMTDGSLELALAQL